MYVIVTCKYEKDLIETVEKMWQQRFSHYKSMAIFPDAQGQLTPHTVVKSSQISNFSELLCMLFIVTCKYEKNRMKNSRDKVATPFSPIITLWELSFAMGTRVLIRSGPKLYAASGCRDIQV